MAENEPKRFPFDTGFYDRPDKFHHYTVKSEGEVFEANEKHGSHPGPAELLMYVWAETSDQAVEVYRKVGSHLGYTAPETVAIEESVAMAPPGQRPSAYNVTFTSKEQG